jgi:site-specific DNA-methyltransferase (cytosine-N4-specific)
MSAPYYSDDSVTLHLGDSLAVMRELPDQSVDCIVTSPPYFGLRDYGNDGQYGLEASPAEYVETMRALFSEARRVLADDGTFWLNVGDSYYSGRGNPGPNAADEKQPARRGWNRSVDKPGVDWAKPKNLLGIPWRTAFALQDDGWILRAEVIWAKRNCLPDPAQDRPARAHEQVFLFSKKRAYWYDADAIREESDPEQEERNQRYAKEYAGHTARAAATGQPGNVNNFGIHSRPGKGGRPARSVWSISAQPFPEAHFAVMPPDLAERCIVAGCRPGGVVLDPFSGSGTTGMVAAKNGRRYVGIDISREYLDLSLRTRLAQSAFDFESAS